MNQTATIVLPTGRLTASAVDVAGRTIEGILVPWDEVGQPSIDGAGRRVKVRRGALTLAAAVTGIDTHDRPTRDVSTLVAHEVRREGIWGRLKVDPTTAGDRLLAAVADGKRLGLSVEATGLLLDPTVDEVVGGVVDRIAHVDEPAFPSARVHAMAAALAVAPTTTTGEPSVTAPVIPAPAPAPEATPAAPAIDYAQLAAALAQQPALQAAFAPSGLPTGALPTAPPAAPSPGLAPSAAPAAHPEEEPVRYAAQLFASVAAGSATSDMHAALENITNSNLPIFQNRSTLGEKLWEGASYQRQFVQLMRRKPLEDWEFTGYQWVQGPRLQDYAGDKTEVPSNPMKAVRTRGVARRLAGAWDIDQKFIDFRSPEFWEEFWTEGTESYLEESDARAAAAIADYAVPLETPAEYPTLLDDEGATAWTYALPAGYTVGMLAPGDVLRVAALATAILEDTPKVRRGPDYIGMNTADWLTLSELTNLDLPAFLALLKVKPEQFMRSSSFAAGRLTAGVVNAATYRELGSVPIRVSAKNVAHGGVDEGLFGYTGISMGRPGGIISLPLTAAAG